MRILIGATNHVQAQAVQRILSARSDVEVELLESGREVVRALATTPFDVLVLDWNLAGIDGLELTRAVRQRWPTMFIMLCSDRNDPEALRLALDAGVDEYLLKPVRPTHLLAKVKARFGCAKSRA